MRLLPLLLCAALLAACGGDDTVPPHGEPRVREITVPEGTLLELDRGERATVAFAVADDRALFNYAVSTAGCQVSLRLADGRSAPAEFALTQVSEGPASGQYTATLTDLGSGTHYSREVCIAIKLPSGELVRSAPFRVRNRGFTAGIVAFRFMKALNPGLPHDIECHRAEGTNLFTGEIPVYQRSMRLVATFEADGAERVEVDGAEQTSGRSANDFRGEVVYTVVTPGGRSECRVRVTNFTRLPVLWIETPGGQAVTSKEVWTEGATMRIDGAGRFDDLEPVPLSIRGRGNSTWEWPKKPFNIRLERRTPLLGMPAHKRWCLLANYMDRTLLRNRVALHLAAQTSLAWTPRCEYAELFLNGEHLGQYLLTEQVRVDGNRVDIAEMSPQDNDGEAVTGGYLLELDFHFDNPWQWHTARNVPFAVKYPDEESLTPQQFAWVGEHIAAVERTLYGDAFADPASGFRRYLDDESFVDYWLVYEVTVNHELGNPGSVYLHKDRGGKLVAGPVWDFDWGTFSYHASPQAQHGLFMTGAWWYGRLFEDAQFRRLAAQRWRTLRPRFLAATDFLDAERERIARSAEVNFRKWPMTTDTNGDERLPFGEAADRMRRILEERIAILDRELGAW